MEKGAADERVPEIYGCSVSSTHHLHVFTYLKRSSLFSESMENLTSDCNMNTIFTSRE